MGVNDATVSNDAAAVVSVAVSAIVLGLFVDVDSTTTQHSLLHKYSVTAIRNKKLSCRRGTARCVVSVEILPIATQQCRNYLYDKS